jgi:outer membrane lipoprotein-sorting protein
MKYMAALLVALFLSAPASYAQDPAETLKGLSAFWDKVETFRCDFVQKKRGLSVLVNDEVISRGTLSYKKPGIMVWRYAPPDDMIIEFKPGLVTLYFPSLKRAKRGNPSGVTGGTAGMSLSMGQTKDTSALTDAFSVTVAHKNGLTEMTLVPKGKKEAIAKIVIVFKDDYTPVSTTIVYTAGSETVLEFSHQQINVPIDDDAFNVVIPPDVVIEDIGK